MSQNSTQRHGSAQKGVSDLGGMKKHYWVLKGYCQEKNEDDGAKESASNGHVLGASNLLSEDLLHSKQDDRQGDGYHAGYVRRQGWKMKHNTWKSSDILPVAIKALWVHKDNTCF